MFTRQQQPPTMPPQVNDNTHISPLLRLPYEIRLMIYEYLLFPSKWPSAGSGTSVANLLPDYHTSYLGDASSDPWTLNVRTVDAWTGPQGQQGKTRLRSTYHVRSGPFLTTTTPTTYLILLSAYTTHLRHSIPSLLPLCRAIHAEAAKVFYATYTFAFHTCIEAGIPFLSDLTPLARSCVRSLSLTKKALPYTKEFDRAEWANLCAWLAEGQQRGVHAHARVDTATIERDPGPCLALRSLRINVVAGKPDHGWDDVQAMSAADFASMARVRSGWGGGALVRGSVGGVDLEWAAQVRRIRGLRDVRVTALVERCARPVSEGQAFWVAFSRSVEGGGFGEWLRGGMVGGKG